MLLHSHLHRVAAPPIEGDDGALLSVADKALALETVLQIERASDDFRPTVADRFAEVQPASRRPPDDPEETFAVLISPPRSRRSDPHTSTPLDTPHQTHASTGGTKGNGVPATSLDDV